MRRARRVGAHHGLIVGAEWRSQLGRNRSLGGSFQEPLHIPTMIRYTTTLVLLICLSPAVRDGLPIKTFTCSLSELLPPNPTKPASHHSSCGPSTATGLFDASFSKSPATSQRLSKLHQGEASPETFFPPILHHGCTRLCQSVALLAFTYQAIVARGRQRLALLPRHWTPVKPPLCIEDPQ